MPEPAQPDADPPMPTDVADYVHDITGGLADMARRAGLSALADALDHAHEVAGATVHGMAAKRAG